MKIPAMRMMVEWFPMEDGYAFISYDGEGVPTVQSASMRDTNEVIQSLRDEGHKHFIELTDPVSHEFWESVLKSQKCDELGQESL